MHLGQEHRARAEVIAADLRRADRFGSLAVGVADDRQVVAERLERRQAARRQIEVASDRRRRPQVLGERRSACCPPRRAPCSMQASRVLPAAAGLASSVRAGTIASRNGSATVAPMPRRTVRREMCFLVRYIGSPVAASRRPTVSSLRRWLPRAHAERRALHDADDERREMILVRAGVADDRGGRPACRSASTRRPSA